MRGLAAEKAGDRVTAETCRCHRPAQKPSGRCRWHGGTAKVGSAHHSYRHGFFSHQHRGILASAGKAYDEVQYLSSLRDELALSKGFLDHKLNEVHAAGPSDQAWIELGASMDAIDRMREAGDRKGMAAELNRQRELVFKQRGSAIARREAMAHIDTHSKVVDREERRKDRQAVVVSVTAFFGFFDMLTEQINTHVSNPAERAAIGKAFTDAIGRANFAEAAHELGTPIQH